MKIGLINPLPEKKIKDFAAKVDKLVVVEELDPIIETHCKTLGLEVTGKDIFPLEGEFSQNLVAAKLGCSVPEGKTIDAQIPPRPPVMCAGCPHRGMFYTLKQNKCTVLGDIGCYTLGAVAPLGAIETTLCMGASIGAVHGFNKILGKESESKTVAVIGDSTFMHSGMTVLKEELAAEEPSVIISRRPCALLKYVKHKAPLKVNTDKCVGCKSCMRIGCPAISIKNGQASVDTTLCVGCGVCSQLCHFDALEAGEKEA